MKLHVQGHLSPYLELRSLKSNCGDIRNGISLAFAERGSWVIRYRDLKRLYMAATKQRMPKAKKGKP